jgi:ABC-type sugar transport system permease subunit
MPLGSVFACAALLLGILTSFYMSFDTNVRNVYTHPGVDCNSDGFDYQQSGTPHSVAVPDLNGTPLTRQDGSPCLNFGDWTTTHTDYWHLLLNIFYWTGLVYGATLIAAHIAKRLRLH